MKIYSSFFALIVVLFFTISCTAQSGKQDNNQVNVNSDIVEVYYFHFTKRCVTCQAIESQSKKFITDLYGDKVSFTALNLDENEGAAKGKDLGINGQTLLIVKGATQINLTNEGFMYARNNPDKLRQILKEKIDPLL